MDWIPRYIRIYLYLLPLIFLYIHIADVQLLSKMTEWCFPYIIIVTCPVCRELVDKYPSTHTYLLLGDAYMNIQEVGAACVTGFKNVLKSM